MGNTIRHNENNPRSLERARIIRARRVAIADRREARAYDDAALNLRLSPGR